MRTQIPVLAAVLTAAAAPALAQGASDYPVSEQMPVTNLQAIAPGSGVTPCSRRYQPVDLPALDAGKPVADAVRDAFDPRDAWGLDQNLALLPPEPGTEGAVLRVKAPGALLEESEPDRRRVGGGFIAPVLGGEGARSACLQYKVRFPDTFSFTDGGRLPGLYGGAPTTGAESGDPSGFTMRFAWREDGDGELVEYIANGGADARYGLSVGPSRWSWRAGVWHTVELESIMNQPDRPDGIARVWIDGEPVIEQTDIAYRREKGAGADGLLFAVFFDNPDVERATPGEKYVDFADLRVFRGGDQTAKGGG